MINLIGLCGHIRNLFPNPVKGSLIREAVMKYLDAEPTLGVQLDLVKAISAQWKRNGWTWSESGAVQLDQDEDVVFHHAGLTFVKSGGDIPDDKEALLPVHLNQSHPRVIWFK